MSTAPAAQLAGARGRGVWQRTAPGERDALVICLVSQGFGYADCALA